MLIRLLFIQRNTINSNYFLAISKDRYRKLKLDIPNPITIFTSFRKDVDKFNKCLHKLFLFSINLIFLKFIYPRLQICDGLFHFIYFIILGI